MVNWCACFSVAIFRGGGEPVRASQNVVCFLKLRLTGILTSLLTYKVDEIVLLPSLLAAHCSTRQRQRESYTHHRPLIYLYLYLGTMRVTRRFYDIDCK